MAKEKQALNEFLESQAALDSIFLATVEPVKATDKVRVTPWQPLGGCLCHAALEVPRIDIASVTLTDQSHSCCGGSKSIVEVEFTPHAQHWREVFKQLSQRSSPVPPSSQGSSGYGATPFIAKCPWCVSICARHPGSEACTECWESCYARDSGRSVVPAIAKCPWCVSICSMHPESGACLACWENCYRGQR